ncbi:hypothetical protein ACXYMU_10930 [Pontibacter sp. CAU 1760]
MRKGLLMLGMLVLAYGTYGQQMSLTDDRLDKVLLAMQLDGVEMANLEMKQELKLSTDQCRQVEHLNAARFERMLEAEQGNKNNELLLSEAYQHIFAESDLSLKQVLSEEQMHRYLELEGRFNAQVISGNK